MFGIPENWDKYDYQTQRYSFDDMEEALETIVKKLSLYDVVVNETDIANDKSIMDEPVKLWETQASELENMLEDVVNELNLSGEMIEKHGPLGTAPAELVRLVLEQKDKEIRILKSGMLKIQQS